MRASSSAWIEGLGDVVVSADLQTYDPVHFFALRRNHDDGGIACLLETPGNRQAILAGEHEIQQDQIDG